LSYEPLLFPLSLSLSPVDQLVELRDSALQSLDELLIEGYDNLTLDLQTSRLE
jgi:hypothetical protein